MFVQEIVRAPRVAAGALLLATGAAGGVLQAQEVHRLPPMTATADTSPELLRVAGDRYEVHAPSAAALERAQLGVEYVLAQYAEVFGEDAPPLAFVLFATNEQAAAYRSRFPDHVVQTWPSSSPRTVSRAGQQLPAHVGARLEPPEEVPTGAVTVAHEAMHSLLRARYGGAILPPWLNEGLASYVEPPAGTERQYWTLLPSMVAHLVPLRELLSMPHPASTAVPVEAPRGNTIRMRTSSRGSAVLYPQSMALLMYVAEVEGPRFLGRLADGIVAGKPLEALLAESRSLPRDVDSLDAAYFGWLRQRGIPAGTHRSGDTAVPEISMANHGATP